MTEPLIYQTVNVNLVSLMTILMRIVKSVLPHVSLVKLMPPSVCPVLPEIIWILKNVQYVLLDLKLVLT